MDHTVDGRHSGHGIFEDALPFTENQIGGNHDGFALIAFSQEGEEDFHFITGVLNITNIIQDHAGKLLELGQLLRKAQISLGGEQTLHQCAGWCPEDRIPCVDELIPYGSQGMTFANTWFANGNHIGGLLEKGSALETLQLQLQCWRKPIEREGAEGLLHRKS